MITFTYRVIPVGRPIWKTIRSQNLMGLDYFYSNSFVNILSSLEKNGQPLVMAGRFNYSGSLRLYEAIGKRKQQ